jgi:hypothetical protein
MYRDEFIVTYRPNERVQIENSPEPTIWKKFGDRGIMFHYQKGKLISIHIGLTC